MVTNKTAWRRLAALGIVGGTLLFGLGWWFVWGLRGWGTQAASTHLASIGADVIFMNVPEIVQRGPPRLVVVRLAQPVELVPHHFAAHKLPAPLSVDAWADVLKAPVVFNGGQFIDAMQYIGWLKSDGQWLNRQRKAGWMGLLVSGPVRGEALSNIVDLALPEHDDAEAVAAAHRHVVQSMMLLDDAAQVRVRASSLAACRTVIAQDAQKRMLVLATEGATTLHALARWLPDSGLGIVRAMNLDGGVESQLAIRTPELRLTLYGQYGTGQAVIDTRQMTRYPLPVVIAAQPGI